MGIIERLKNINSEEEYAILNVLNDYVVGQNSNLEEIEEAFDLILSKLEGNEIDVFLYFIESKDELRKLLKDKSAVILKRIALSKGCDNEKAMSSFSEYMDMISEEEFSNDEIKEMIAPTMTFATFGLINALVGKNSLKLTEERLQEIKIHINEGYKEHKAIAIGNIAIQSIVRNSTKDYGKRYDAITEEYQDFIVTLFSELVEKAGIEFTDVEFKGNGFHADVYKIGDKILKIGRQQNTLEVPNSKYMLKPLIRYNLKDKDGNGVILVEVEEELETNLNPTEDIVYNMYKKLREEGIVWTDPKLSNIGRLKRKNISYLNEEEINIDQRINGFDVNNKEVLDAGEYVVFDIDYLYREDSVVTMFEGEYEKRWKKEKEDKER